MADSPIFTVQVKDANEFDIRVVLPVGEMPLTLLQLVSFGRGDILLYFDSPAGLRLFLERAYDAFLMAERQQHVASWVPLDP